MTESPNELTPASSGIQEESICGIVMPISSNDIGTEQHWLEVRRILEDSITESGFKPNLVSYAAEIGVIHGRIVENLYRNPIVVCDVSGTNANVMLELGMRLAFDKPVIIVKDRETKYSFDTSPIEHLSYPRDLRFSSILDFKAKLALKIRSTIDASKNANYTTFLKHFGSFAVAKIETTSVPGYELLARRIEELILRSDRLRTNEKRSFWNSGALSGTEVPNDMLTEIAEWIDNTTGKIERGELLELYDLGRAEMAVEIFTDKLERVQVNPFIAALK